MAFPAFTYPDTYGLSWERWTTNTANMVEAFRAFKQSLSAIGHAFAPLPSLRDRDRLALAWAVRTVPAPTRAVLRPRCHILTLYPHRTIVARGTVSWVRQGGRRPLRCRTCR